MECDKAKEGSTHKEGAATIARGHAADATATAENEANPRETTGALRAPLLTPSGCVWLWRGVGVPLFPLLFVVVPLPQSVKPPFVKRVWTR